MAIPGTLIQSYASSSHQSHVERAEAAWQLSSLLCSTPRRCRNVPCPSSSSSWVRRCCARACRRHRPARRGTAGCRAVRMRVGGAAAPGSCHGPIQLREYPDVRAGRSGAIRIGSAILIAKIDIAIADIGGFNDNLGFRHDGALASVSEPAPALHPKRKRLLCRGH